jgi:hypothetical protein
MSLWCYGTHLSENILMRPEDVREMHDLLPDSGPTHRQKCNFTAATNPQIQDKRKLMQYTVQHVTYFIFTPDTAMTCMGIISKPNNGTT